MFLAVSILVVLTLIPTYFIYQKYNNFEFPFSHYTLGNMGSASQQCLAVPLTAKSVAFSCSAGYIYRMNVVGLNPSSNPD